MSISYSALTVEGEGGDQADVADLDGSPADAVDSPDGSIVPEPDGLFRLYVDENGQEGNGRENESEYVPGHSFP